MNSIPIEYLHSESAVMFLFIAMVLGVQFGRATDPGYFVQRGRMLLWWLASAFLIMTVGFSAALVHATPLMGIELAAGITLSMLHPVNALCFMIHLAILRPWEIDTDNTALMILPRLMIVLCLFSWLIHPKQHASPSWRNLKCILFLMGFSVWLFLSTFKAGDIGKAQGYYFDTYFKIMIMFGMALFLIESDRSVREVELTLVVSSMSLMGVGFYQFFTGTMKDGRLQSTGLLGDPNDLAAIIVMALPFALGPVFENTTGRLAKAGGVIYTGLAAFVIWLSRSRGGMLAVVAQFLAFRIVKKKQSRWSMLLMTGICIAGYVGLMSVIPRDASDMANSEGSRITLWKSAVNMAVHNPILGIGFNQFPLNYEFYAVGTVYEWGRKTAHSSWFLSLGETGFPGCFFFIAFFVSVVRIAWQNRDKRPYQFYSVVGYGVAMSFLSHTYSQYYYLLMALILASTNVKTKELVLYKAYGT